MFPGKNIELNEGTKTYANIESILNSVKIVWMNVINAFCKQVTLARIRQML